MHVCAVCAVAVDRHSLLSGTVLVLSSVISHFGHWITRKGQSTVTIIRDPKGLIYKECLNQVESLAKSFRKDKNNWWCLVDTWMFPCVFFGLSSHFLHHFPHSLLLHPAHPNTHSFLTFQGEFMHSASSC